METVAKVLIIIGIVLAAAVFLTYCGAAIVSWTA